MINPKKNPFQIGIFRDTSTLQSEGCGFIQQLGVSGVPVPPSLTLTIIIKIMIVIKLRVLLYHIYSTIIIRLCNYYIIIRSLYIHDIDGKAINDSRPYLNSSKIYSISLQSHDS